MNKDILEKEYAEFKHKFIESNPTEDIEVNLYGTFRYQKRVIEYQEKWICTLCVLCVFLCLVLLR